MNVAMWITLLTPVVGPILTELAKKLAPKLPSWLIPIIAVILGAGSNLVASNVAGTETDLLKAALLGLGGIGVREVVHHGKDVLASETKSKK